MKSRVLLAALFTIAGTLAGWGASYSMSTRYISEVVLIAADSRLETELKQLPVGRVWSRRLTTPLYSVSADGPTAIAARDHVRQVIGRLHATAVAPPSLPTRPASPNRPVIAAMGAAAGLTSGILIGLIRMR